VGSKVLVLLPSVHNKMLLRWKGPFDVIKKTGNYNYLVEMEGTQKVFHTNMLREFVQRETLFPKTVSAASLLSDSHVVAVTHDQVVDHVDDRDVVNTRAGDEHAHAVDDRDVVNTHDGVEHAHAGNNNTVECVPGDVVFDVRHDDCLIASVAVVDDDDGIEDGTSPVIIGTVPSIQSETIKDVVFDKQLSPSRKEDALRVFEKHSSILTDLPGDTSLVEHEIRLNTDKPVCLRPYPLPFGKEGVIEEEVNKMMNMGVIEPSTSPYSSPVVLVKKKDGSVRFCIDFRRLNQATQFDAEPIPDPEALFVQLADKNWFTKVDLAKGYWQIRVAETDRPKTAFKTPSGLYQFVRMPFGLSTAPSTFARMMRKLNLQRFSTISFFDDALVTSVHWDEHLVHLDGLLSELEKHGLTARPSKIECGFTEVEFLGHMVGKGKMAPTKGKVSKILNVSEPQTKKQVRSFLGLVGFYRRYVPNYADLVAPLTALTKKNGPNKVHWSTDCQTAFDKLKQTLSSDPVVILPDFNAPFTVRTDASSTGLGGVLMQPASHGELHPVLYASRQLLPRERNYSAIERECLAVVWACGKFSRYLSGRHFVLETDHRPLTFLRQKGHTNARLLRWALALQDLTFSVSPIPGRTNHTADVLSRL
jgi:hypothetical protein